MDIRDYRIDILFMVVPVISTLILILRFWQDLTSAVVACLMMLSPGGMFSSCRPGCAILKTA